MFRRLGKSEKWMSASSFCASSLSQNNGGGGNDVDDGGDDDGDGDGDDDNDNVPVPLKFVCVPLTSLYVSNVAVAWAPDRLNGILEYRSLRRLKFEVNLCRILRDQ